MRWRNSGNFAARPMIVSPGVVRHELNVSTYRYVGPEEIRRAAESSPAGTVVDSPVALERWLDAHPDALDEGATFIVTMEGLLKLAPRRSEHVACAGGEPVLAAGEIRFRRTGKNRLEAAEVTNQSTGYCPDPACWDAVSDSLRAAKIPTPAAFTHAFIFRRCDGCGQVNIVKDNWFICANCDRNLRR
jgi:hypothetical protein